MYGTGQYTKARIEYERLLFENNAPELKNKLLLKKSRCYKTTGDHENAYKTLLRGNLFTPDDSVNFMLRYEIALNAYLAYDYSVSLTQLKQIGFYIKDESLKTQVLFLEVLTLNELIQWEEAKTVFEKYSDLNDLELNVDSIYAFIHKPKLKNVKTAKKLSYFAPGIGQIYAGYPGKGIFSSLIQGSLLAFGAYSLYEGYFFTGAFTGIGLFYSFYSGGARHAEFLAQKKNNERVSRYNGGIRKLILEVERQKKAP